MATQAQIVANRRNAQRSTGPLTPRGKAVASQNSLKHGLSARRHVIAPESQADYDLYRDQILDELNPLTPIESMLADRVICLSWRLKRAVRTQNQALDALLQRSSSDPLAKLAKSFGLKGLALPQPDPADSNPDLILGRIALKDFSNERVLDRLLMYERRIEHSLFKTMLELQRLRLLRNLESSEPNLQPEHSHLAPGFTGGSSQQSPKNQPPTTPPFSPRDYAAGHNRTKQDAPEPPQTQTYPIPAPRDSVRDTLHASRLPHGGDMQNEPNSKTAKMNITLYNKTGYEKDSPFVRRKNEPKRTQTKPMVK